MLLLGGFAAVATQLPAVAQEPVTVVTKLIAEVRVSAGTAQGRASYRFVPATKLSQGQAVYYTLRITNPADAFVDKVVVVQRIPENTVYVPGSAAGPGADIAFSIDGGLTFAPADQLTAEVAGKVQPVQASRYTHIRWSLRHPLAPGAVALARFQAVFN